MAITLETRVEGFNESKLMEAINESINYFGFYSGVVDVEGARIQFWRDRKVKDSVLLIVAKASEW